jgi:hypothetical protein
MSDRIEVRRIEVQGLRDLRRDLQQAENRTPNELQQANLRAAGIIAREAQRRAPAGPHQGRGKPRVVTPIRSSIKAQATAGKAYVTFGGARSPHAPVYEFGGSIPRRGARATHGALIKKAQAGHRSFGSFGISTTRIEKRAYVYPALEAEEGRMLQQYELALRSITRKL